MIRNVVYKYTREKGKKCDIIPYVVVKDPEYMDEVTRIWGSDLEKKAKAIRRGKLTIGVKIKYVSDEAELKEIEDADVYGAYLEFNNKQVKKAIETGRLQMLLLDSAERLTNYIQQTDGFKLNGNPKDVIKLTA